MEESGKYYVTTSLCVPIILCALLIHTDLRNMLTLPDKNENTPAALFWTHRKLNRSIINTKCIFFSPSHCSLYLLIV